MERMRIGFLSFRVSGNDGVSLEAVRWKIVLERLHHKVLFIAGELDRKGILIPRLQFTIPEIQEIHQEIVMNHTKFSKLEERIFSLAGKIEGELRETFRRFSLDRLLVANVFSLPLHFPLTVALERVITEFKIPTIARHHDFWWERKRYQQSTYFSVYKRYFPPVLPLVTHVTINSIAQKELEKKSGVHSIVIGDSFDFESKYSTLDSFSGNFRKDFGIKPNDIVFLQPTRIVPRKHIELSIRLVRDLHDERIILVLTGDPTDEGLEYAWKLLDLVQKEGIRAKFIGHRVSAKRQIINQQRIYTLWDCFANADFVTYPSAVEGFGNQLIEAIYFKKPLLVNRYAVFETDIEPLGFDTIAINDQLTEHSVKKVREILDNPGLKQKMVERNFNIGKKHFSFEALKKKLRKLGF